MTGASDTASGVATSGSGVLSAPIALAASIVAGIGLVVVFALYGILRWAAAPDLPPDPQRELVVRTEALSIIPPADPRVKAELVAGVNGMLRQLYEESFFLTELAERPDPSPGPSPTPDATPRPLPLAHFTRNAGRTLREHRGLFTADGIDVQRGTVTFVGVLTRQNRTPVGAELEVRFQAEGEAFDGTPVRLSQRGDLRLVWTDEVWRVSGFDLTLQTEPRATPAATP